MKIILFFWKINNKGEWQIKDLVWLLPNDHQQGGWSLASAEWIPYKGDGKQNKTKPKCNPEKMAKKKWKIVKSIYHLLVENNENVEWTFKI